MVYEVQEQRPGGRYERVCCVRTLDEARRVPVTWAKRIVRKTSDPVVIRYAWR
jgi:hypothetical protein